MIKRKVSSSKIVYPEHTYSGKVPVMTSMLCLLGRLLLWTLCLGSSKDVLFLFLLKFTMQRVICGTFSLSKAMSGKGVSHVGSLTYEMNQCNFLIIRE